MGEDRFRKVYSCSFMVAYSKRSNGDKDEEQATVEWCAPTGFDQLMPGSEVLPLTRPGESSLGMEISLGRSSKNDIIIHAPKVSKTHAIFRCDEKGNYFLRDLGSLNGTKVNNKRLSGDSEVEIKSGDVIAFFDAIYIFTSLDNMILKLTYL